MLVVLCHAYMLARIPGDFPSWLSGINHHLANIRMPLFFLTSGLLLGRLVVRPWGQLMRKRVIPMVWLLLVWTAIGSAVNLAVPLYPWAPGAIPSVLEAIWLPQGTMWFIYVLIICATLARVTALASGHWRPVVAVGLWLALVSYDQWRGEFHTRNIVQYFPFYMAGVLGGPHILRATSSRQGLVAIAAVSLLGVIAVWLAGLGGLPGKAVRNVFGTGLFVVAAATIQRWPAITRPLDVAGRNSLAIFLGHIPILAIAYAVLPLEFAHPVVAWLALFALAVAGAWMLEMAARRMKLTWLYAVPEPIVDGLTSWFVARAVLSRS